MNSSAKKLIELTGKISLKRNSHKAKIKTQISNVGLISDNNLNI